MRLFLPRNAALIEAFDGPLVPMPPALLGGVLGDRRGVARVYFTGVTTLPFRRAHGLPMHQISWDPQSMAMGNSSNAGAVT